jgi:hypothetical protein
MHNEDLHNLYSSLNIMGAIKSRMIKWTMHVADTEEMIHA